MHYRWSWSVTDSSGATSATGPLATIRRKLNRNCQPALSSILITHPDSAELLISLYQTNDKFRSNIDAAVTTFAKHWLQQHDLGSVPIDYEITPTLICESDVSL